MSSPTFAEVVAALARPRRPVVLIDGGSGAGKSTLADALAQAWPSPLTVVSLDDLHQGWDGLAAGSEQVANSVLAREGAGYRGWDWERDRPGSWTDVDPASPLLIEGCGALTPANRALATAGIWVVGGPDERRRRALARDPEVFAGHWERWAAQERAHWRTHAPRTLADWWFVGGRFIRPRRP